MSANALKTIARAAPFIVGNPFIPHWPHPKQMLGLGMHVGHNDKTGPYELLFGGAAGGGKSDWLLMLAAQHAWRFGHYRGVVLRRTHTEMVKSGAIMTRALQWWLPLKVHWDGTSKMFRFPSGATIEMGYHGHPTDDAKYQGGEWHDALFDELTHWPDESAFDWLRSRLRKGENDPVPRRLMAASNPGSDGHTWVKNRFIGGYDIGTGVRYEARSAYLPSTIDDNPSIDREAYKATLQQMHPTRRAQLLDGDWSAREPGDYFRLEWFGPMLGEDFMPSKSESISVRWWDLAASEAEDAARTASCRMARMRSGVRVVVHATAFRATPGKRDAKIVQQAMLDGKHVTVGIEIEGGSGGPAQFEALCKRLKAEGFRVVGARPRVGGPQLTPHEKGFVSRNPLHVRGKEGRADPVASCLERGYQRRGECDDTGEKWWGDDIGHDFSQHCDGLRLVAGTWTQGYLDELEGFPGATLCDLVDATSGAWAWLEAHPFGLRNPPRSAPPKVSEHDANAHPDERDDPVEKDKDAGGRWRPGS